ncbi:hypothetical protein SCLCIDRAFT_340505 [Scleroderma citrinum Foug A]|uniref:glycerol-3-phosphate dehydrogenase n=1 Tax=Scleroderma citrinum Foug A TaxID=1036808 RepID=A0A0C3DFI0_9AGAM|nr:hypothetical protein SCLCIDRAFT_340505 [Scleroderma citrinum Foug A]
MSESKWLGQYEWSMSYGEPQTDQMRQITFIVLIQRMLRHSCRIIVRGPCAHFRSQQTSNGRLPEPELPLYVHHLVPTLITPRFPPIEAEDTYAARHEYTCTTIDILARRNRLAFVNAQVALSALPRVIEIISEELGWNRTRQREKFERGFKYLQSTGLAPGAINNSIGEYPWDRRSHAGWTRWVTGGFWCLLGMHSATTPATKAVSQLYNRAKFEAGEVEALRDIFDSYAVTPLLQEMLDRCRSECR